LTFSLYRKAQRASFKTIARDFPRVKLGSVLAGILTFAFYIAHQLTNA